MLVSCNVARTNTQRAAGDCNSDGRHCSFYNIEAVLQPFIEFTVHDAATKLLFSFHEAELNYFSTPSNNLIHSLVRIRWNINIYHFNYLRRQVLLRHFNYEFLQLHLFSNYLRWNVCFKNHMCMRMLVIYAKLLTTLLIYVTFLLIIV